VHFPRGVDLFSLLRLLHRT